MREWHGGYWHGFGTSVDATGNRYEGGWRCGKYHGRGMHRTANDDAYEGEWCNGEKCWSTTPL